MQAAKFAFPKLFLKTKSKLEMQLHGSTALNSLSSTTNKHTRASSARYTAGNQIPGNQKWS